MKTQNLILGLVAALTISTVTVTAQDCEKTKENLKHQVSIQINVNNQVSVYADNLEKDRSSYVLRIYNEEGGMIYATSMNKKGAIKRAYDLEQFPEGNYKFAVYSGLKKVYSQEIIKQTVPVPVENGEELLTELVLNK